MKKIVPFSLLIFSLFVNNVSTFAQCAMCKTTAESDLKTGGSIATGLNTGILYLMTIPYIILILGGYFFFRKQIHAKIKSMRNK